MSTPAQLQVIYGFRSAIENGVVAYLTALGLTALTRQNAITSFNQKTPRVEVRADIGGSNGHKAICPDGQLRFDQFTFGLRVQCIVRPNSDPAQNTMIEQYIGTVRGLMSTVGGIPTANDTINFPLHYIAEPLRDVNTLDSLKSDEGLEMSTLSYSGVIMIRHSAWPLT